MRAALACSLAGLCVLLGVAPGLLRALARRRSAPGDGAADRARGPRRPGHGRPADARPRRRAGLALAALLRACGAGRRAAPDAGLGLRAAGGAGARLDVGRLHQAAAAGAGVRLCAPSARSRSSTGGTARPGGRAIAREVPHLFDTLLYEPASALALRAARASPAGCSPAACAPTSLYLLGARARAARCSRGPGRSGERRCRAAGAVAGGGRSRSRRSLPGIVQHAQGAPPGPPRSVAAAALPRAAPAVAQERGRSGAGRRRSTGSRRRSSPRRCSPPACSSPIGGAALDWWPRQRRARARRPARARPLRARRSRRGTPATASR